MHRFVRLTTPKLSVNIVTFAAFASVLLALKAQTNYASENVV